jgi:hypothetical protein
VPKKERASVTAVIVAYGEPESVNAAVEALSHQSLTPCEIIVVDNHPHRESTRYLRESKHLQIIYADNNGGYTGGVALGIKEVDSEFVFLINPDARAAEDCLERLYEVMLSRPQAAVAGAQILLPDGTTNAGENPLHISGFSWSGRYQQPSENGNARQVLAVSGAALLVRTQAYRQIKGMANHFFLYCDDTDLCWRARACGYQVWFCPRARVVHDYVFDKGKSKYRYLERNRLAMLAANFEERTLLALTPLLVALEIGVWLLAWRDHWLREKGYSYLDLIGSRRERRIWREQMQSQRVLSDHQLLPWFVSEIETPLLGERANKSTVLKVANSFFAAYKRFLLAVTR